MTDLICGLRLCSANFIRVGASESDPGGGGGRARGKPERIDERCEDGPDDRKALEQCTEAEDVTRVDLVIRSRGRDV